MRRVVVEAQVFGLDDHTLFEALCDFESYPKFTDTIREVVTSQGNGELISEWEVNFRQGILRWKEKDVFCPEKTQIAFQQIAGDIEHFSGEWILRPESEGCSISFWADLDLGIPSLSDMLEPIAEAALKENIKAIIGGVVSHLGGDMSNLQFTPVATQGGNSEYVTAST